MICLLCYYADYRILKNAFYLVYKIEDGEIFATINQKDGMVTFHDNPEKYNSVGMLMKLDEEVRIHCAVELCYNIPLRPGIV